MRPQSYGAKAIGAQGLTEFENHLRRLTTARALVRTGDVWEYCRMSYSPFHAAGSSFEIHEWRGSGPATLHVHNSDDEAWHVLAGELKFRYADRIETAGPGTTVFVPAGVAHTFTADSDARYLIILTPRLKSLIDTLQADRDPAHQREIYRRFDSELLE